jgi:hypothetical protein
LRNPQTGAIIGDSPLMNSLIVLIMLLFLVTGFAYGRAAGVINTLTDAIGAITKTFSGLGGLLFLCLVIAQFLAYFNYSNIATIVAVTLGDALKSAHLGAVPLLIMFVVVTALLNLIIPAAIAKWADHRDWDDADRAEAEEIANRRGEDEPDPVGREQAVHGRGRLLDVVRRRIDDLIRNTRSNEIHDLREHDHHDREQQEHHGGVRDLVSHHLDAVEQSHQSLRRGDHLLHLPEPFHLLVGARLANLGRQEPGPQTLPIRNGPCRAGQGNIASEPMDAAGIVASMSYRSGGRSSPAIPTPRSRRHFIGAGSFG